MSENHHAIPRKYLIGTFISLLTLTVLTVLIATVHLGDNLNLILALAIATLKGTLVCLFFMGLLFDNRINAVILLSNFVFLFIFFSIVLTDLKTRQVSNEYWGKSSGFESPVETATETDHYEDHEEDEGDYEYEVVEEDDEH